ncbi:MAG TPA: hypothetical protein VF636_09845, partial [Sphingomonas sp.]
DFLVGGAGNDRLNGGEGTDTLLGGAGFDLFRFDGSSTVERISDFSRAQGDKIDLRVFNIDFSDVDQSASGSTNVLSIDTNGDDVLDFTITLLNGATVAANDFLF